LAAGQFLDERRRRYPVALIRRFKQHLSPLKIVRLGDGNRPQLDVASSFPPACSNALIEAWRGPGCGVVPLTMLDIIGSEFTRDTRSSAHFWVLQVSSPVSGK
jgi:hypothetical protein